MATTVPNVPDPTAGKQTSTESALSTWAGPTITENIGRAEALSQTPYEVYQGPLTAGQSALQTKAFEGIGNLTIPTAAQTTYTPTSFTSSGVAQQYMSPYIESALNPQLAEARRQAEISRIQRMGQLQKVGAVGGGRQAVLEALLDENLQRQLAGITGAGYQKAYESAAQQFNTEQARQQSATQLAQDYGMKALQAQLGAGATQRDIEQQGITADLAEFEKQREYPYKQASWLQGLFQGMPVAAQNYGYQQASLLGDLFGTGGGLLSLLQGLGLFNAPQSSGSSGQTTPQTNPSPATNPAP